MKTSQEAPVVLLPQDNRQTPFYSPQLERAEYPNPQVDLEVIQDLGRLLGDAELQRKVEAGHITLAMIRPDLANATNTEGDDPTVAFAIESGVMGLGVLAKFAVQFDETTVNEFYAGPKQGMLTRPPEHSAEFPNRWVEFESLMLAGPTTVLLLESPIDNAVELWRQQVGHWDITNRRDPVTLRGRFGLNSHNNLIHGSDSPEAVLRELAVISQCLK